MQARFLNKENCDAQASSSIAEHVNKLRNGGQLVIINVDGDGVGDGVIDRLHSVGFDGKEVQFGGRDMAPTTWANRRAEIWGTMREWLARGAIPRDQLPATDLTGVESMATTRQTRSCWRRGSQ